jgi:hypothetical protein
LGKSENFFKIEKPDNAVEVQNARNTHPMVVIKLVVKEPSEKRKRRQLLPTPVTANNKRTIKSQAQY